MIQLIIETEHGSAQLIWNSEKEFIGGLKALASVVKQDGVERLIERHKERVAQKLLAEMGK